jgi:hypothetical protein
MHSQVFAIPSCVGDGATGAVVLAGVVVDLGGVVGVPLTAIQ